MENDTIRTSGGKTFVDVWIEGKVRGICVSRGAVEAYLGLSSERGAMSDEERCDFVRTHMALVMKAATQKLREMGMAAGDVVIEPGELGPSLTGRGGDRRKMQRRKGERRKADRPDKVPPTGDRRKADRRKSERRSKPKEA
jgi:hypothetical protein